MCDEKKYHIPFFCILVFFNSPGLFNLSLIATYIPNELHLFVPFWAVIARASLVGLLRFEGVDFDGRTPQRKTHLSFMKCCISLHYFFCGLPLFAPDFLVPPISSIQCPAIWTYWRRHAAGLRLQWRRSCLGSLGGSTQVPRRLYLPTADQTSIVSCMKAMQTFARRWGK